MNFEFPQKLRSVVDRIGINNILAVVGTSLGVASQAYLLSRSYNNGYQAGYATGFQDDRPI